MTMPRPQPIAPRAQATRVRPAHGAPVGAVAARPGDAPGLYLLALALGGALLTYVWRVQDLYPVLNAIKLPIVVSLIALAAYVFDGDPRRRLEGIKQSPITKLLILIMALAVLSIPMGVYPGYSFGFIRDDFGKDFLLVLILAASVRTFADVERYVAFVVVGGMAYAEFVFLYVPVASNGRLGGGLVYYDANDLGMLLVCSIPLALYFLLRGRTIVHRVVALAALGLYGVTIIKTGSRGAFIGLIALGVYVLLGFSSIAPWKRVTAVAVGVLLLLTRGTDKYWTMMATLLHPQEDYNWTGGAEMGRMEVWKRGIGYMLSHPFLGVGVDAFPIAEGSISPLAVRQQLGIGVKWSAAHNSFVQIGAELGVFGLAAFCALLVVCFRTLREIRARSARAGAPPTDAQVLSQALAGSIVAYIFCGFFLSQAYAAYALTLYAMIIGLRKLLPAGPLPGGLARGKGRRRAFDWSRSGPGSLAGAPATRPT